MDILNSMVELKVKLGKVGNSYKITIPIEIIEALNLTEGDILTIDAVNGKIIASPFSVKEEKEDQ